MDARSLIWDHDYTHLVVIKHPDGEADRKCKIFIHGEDYSHPLLVSNVTLYHDTTTVFDFFGTIYSGTKKLNLKVYDYPNGVRCGELTVVDAD